MEEISLYSVDSSSDELQSPFRGGVHNCKYITSDKFLATVPDSLYVALKEKEITYDIPIDAPLYATLSLYEPDNTDIENKEG